MAVLVGSASINELGELEGGKLGDQNGREVLIEDWYLHRKGWRVIRAKDPLVRAKISQNMRYICENDNIGYSYWDNCYGLLNESKKYGYNASKVKVKCDTNCAKSVRCSILYAGVNVEDFSTFDEVDKCRNTGAFEILDSDLFCKSPDYLVEGDILVTKTKGHTVVVLNNGDNVKSLTPYQIKNCAFCNVRKGPNVNYGITGVLKGFDIVEVLEWSKEGWGLIKFEDILGFVSPKFLEELGTAKCVGDTWLRDDAGKNVGKQIFVIKNGSTVFLTGAKKLVGKTTWYELIFNGSKGWASGLYIKPN